MHLTPPSLLLSGGRPWHGRLDWHGLHSCVSQLSFGAFYLSFWDCSGFWPEWKSFFRNAMLHQHKRYWGQALMHMSPLVNGKKYKICSNFKGSPPRSTPLCKSQLCVGIAVNSSGAIIYWPSTGMPIWFTGSTGNSRILHGYSHGPRF